MFTDGYFVPLCDIIETPDFVIIQVELPGLINYDDNVIIELSDGILEIKGEITNTILNNQQSYLCKERTIGRFKKTIPINQAVCEQNIKAKLNNGILSIEIQKIIVGCLLNKQKIHII